MPIRTPLRDGVAVARQHSARALAAFGSQILLDDLATGTPFGTASFEGRSVLLQTTRQLPTVLALLELDGLARRMVLAPADITMDHLDSVITTAAIDLVVTDDPAHYQTRHPHLQTVACSPALSPRAHPRTVPPPVCDTEWVLFTSGTTGRPKLVGHTLRALTGPIRPMAPAAVWSTFYDVRRYGGLQILLRGLLGGGSMVLSDAAEDLAAFLARAGSVGVTHISGTPSHWRRVLMSGHAGLIAPAYIRLSGEIADQALLDRLQEAYPAARVAHAFASTEAGVAFDVTDGRAGFPASWVGRSDGVELRVVDATLRVRSSRTATGLIGGTAPADADGFVDTGDIVALQGDRYVFVGRTGGVINVGGQKVHPEEVEAALQAHPAVLAARVRARASPITGAVVSAEIVVREVAGVTPATLRAEILHASRARLAEHKVPAVLRIVSALEVLPSGKLARPHG